MIKEVSYTSVTNLSEYQKRDQQVKTLLHIRSHPATKDRHSVELRLAEAIIQRNKFLLK